MYFRQPKTSNERKKIANATNQGVKVRPKRNENHLVNDWDDLQKVFQRSWKRFRQHQYK